ncbi:hypothetical protein [uncultured Bacteroides sp.]|uniref:hypothetical protein n=1 Tax=uncultured Bacteroides sp. TaxID=162156 RepID=UPI00259A5ECB|nr:hypothetical protein [uncultured Bacteroides sp.]
MSTFGMFTIVLIILYIVYYAIIISRDIYGKKSMRRSEEEEFDVSALQEDEIAVSVEESENGFLLNTRPPETGAIRPASSTLSDNTEAFTPSVPFDNPVSSGPMETASTPGDTSAVQEKIDKVQEKMEEIAPIGNLTMGKEFFRDLLLQANKEGSLFAQKPHASAV